MPVRKILLALGVVCVLGGVALLVVWLGQARKAAPESVQTRVETRVSVITAATAIPRGASLKSDNLKSKELGPNEHLQPGSIVSGQEGEFLGALSQRDIAEGEPLIASDFTKANFLAMELKPGYQAITIPVDAAQSLSGLALQHDYVDVILIQSFGDKINIRYRTVGETVVRGVRVMALDQSLTRPIGVMAAVVGANVEAAIPRTVTLEVTEEQAEKLLVASKLGSFQLSLLPLKVAVAIKDPIKLRDWFSPLSLKVAAADKLEDHRNGKPVWAKDVSPAVNEIGKPEPPQAAEPSRAPPSSPCPPVTGSTLDKSVRCAPSNSVYYRAPANATPEAGQAPQQGQSPDVRGAPAPRQQGSEND